MNVAELMAQLAKLPADMPVVVAQEDEPLGNYGVAGVDRVRMKRDDSWSSYREVWDHGSHYGAGPDERVEVCYLDTDTPPTQVVDAEVVEPAQQREVPCPSCGNPLLVSAVTLPGDQAVCGRCQQIVNLPLTPATTALYSSLHAAGPGWRELADKESAILAGHSAAIEAYDRDTRTLATADQAQTELADEVMPAALARLDLALSCGRCFVCDKPASELTCSECTKLVDPHIGRTP